MLVLSFVVFGLQPSRRMLGIVKCPTRFQPWSGVHGTKFVMPAQTKVQPPLPRTVSALALRYLAALLPCLILTSFQPTALAQTPVVDLGSRRELFVDHHLIAKLDRTRLRLHEPHDEGAVLRFDQPWEGVHCGYCTVLRDGPRLRVYYRGMPANVVDGTDGEVTCIAESNDGSHWTKPNLGLFEVRGTRSNNVVLAGEPPFSHNFAPFIDTRPACPPEQRYKAMAGLSTSGLAAYVSADGLRWKGLRADPVIPEMAPF